MEAGKETCPCSGASSAVPLLLEAAEAVDEGVETRSCDMGDGGGVAEEEAPRKRISEVQSRFMSHNNL